MNIEDALRRLAADNFKTRSIGVDEDIQIHGYLERSRNESGIENNRGSCFVIAYENDQWEGVIPTAMPYDTVLSRSPDLAEVVEGVCDFYSARETTTNDGMTLEEAIRSLEEGGMSFSAVYDDMDLAWGKSHQHVKTPDGLLSERFCINWHFDAWLAIYITVEAKNQPIKYSKALGDVVQAVLDFYRDQGEASPEVSA